MKKGWIILIAIILVLILSVKWYIGGLNRIVRMHESVSASWAEIDNQLKRRNDLIPNLVNTVKGYAKQEKDVFANIADARAKLAGAGSVKDKMAANNEMGAALSRLLVVVENYPNLKSDANFRALMDELAGTENRISVSRMRYNKDVKFYNTYIKEVFGSFFAKKRGLNEPFVYFEVAETEKVLPKVSFE